MAASPAIDLGEPLAALFKRARVADNLYRRYEGRLAELGVGDAGHLLEEVAEGRFARRDLTVADSPAQPPPPARHRGRARATESSGASLPPPADKPSAVATEDGRGNAPDASDEEEKPAG